MRATRTRGMKESLGEIEKRGGERGDSGGSDPENVSIKEGGVRRSVKREELERKITWNVWMKYVEG